ncbi:MAG: CIA30 family protein [Pararhodobacter sp.]|nr:CIA30 family protein [Pararhodobacter sp.]
MTVPQKEAPVRGLIPLFLAAVVGIGTASAGDTVIEDFNSQPETRWRFFTDQVMGGLSTGQVAFMQDAGQGFARMTGRVSTANRGGFIQMRQDIDSPPADSTTGIRLIVRGDGQGYFVHLRTTGSVLPWQFYQAGFDTTESWQELRLPLNAFAASGGLQRAVPRAGTLTSIAIAAYGRDHDARIDVLEIGFY